MKRIAIIAAVLILFVCVSARAVECYACPQNWTPDASCDRCVYNYDPDWGFYWDCGGYSFSWGTTLWRTCEMSADPSPHCITTGFGCGSMVVEWEPLKRFKQNPSCALKGLFASYTRSAQPFGTAPSRRKWSDRKNQT